MINFKQRDILVSHILSLISYLEDNHIPLDNYIEHMHNKFYEKGYYAFYQEKDNVNYILETHIEGRKAIYKNVVLTEENDCFTVKSYKDIDLNENPSFFYFDIDMKKFREFAKLIALKNAHNMGVKMNIVYTEDCEITYIYK